MIPINHPSYGFLEGHPKTVHPQHPAKPPFAEMNIYIIIIIISLVGFKRDSSLLDIFSHFSWGLIQMEGIPKRFIPNTLINMGVSLFLVGILTFAGEHPHTVHERNPFRTT